MDLIIAVLVILLALWLIKAVGLSLWAIVLVLAAVALAVYIYRNSRLR